MTLIISVLNNKGGVGKTRTVVELAYQASILGLSSLVVDLDPQGNATWILTGKTQDKTIFDVFLGNLRSVDVIVPAREAWPNCAIIPANRNLQAVDAHITNKLCRESILKNSLDLLKGKVDLIIIDSAPTVNLLTVNALVASDLYIVPTDMSENASNGAKFIKSLADQIKTSGLNPKIKLGGVFVTGYQKGMSIAVKKVLEDIHMEHKESILPFKVPHSTVVIAADKANQPVGKFSPENPISKEYCKLAKSILEVTK